MADNLQNPALDQDLITNLLRYLTLLDILNCKPIACHLRLLSPVADNCPPRRPNSFMVMLQHCNFQAQLGDLKPPSPFGRRPTT
eukprot:3374156-Alexandrium_andersonii.AAC.1